MPNSKISLKGRVHLQVFGPDGELKEDRYEDNLVVTAGLAYIADAISASPGNTVMTHMALGSGTSGPAAGDTTLGNEFGTGGRNALTGSTPTDAGAVVTYTCTFTAGESTGAITEAGILNNSSGGTLLARLVFSAINKAAADTLAITWTLTFADDGVA